ncbi:MAG: GIN domain-containing protein [Alphaproteobacteria bacterium]
MSFRLPPLLLALLALASPANAASRNFTVTGFERIRVDGPFRVALKTGVAPFAKATGSPAALNGVAIDVQGNTLVVRRNPTAQSAYPGESAGPVEISVGTHDLNAAWVNGAGSLAIDKAKAQVFDLSVQGPGSISIGRLTADRLRAGLSGSGSASVAGTAAVVKAVVRGTSSFDATALNAKDVDVGAEGTAVVRLTATGTAKVDALGTALVELSGRPACTTRASGSAVVSGCR